MGMDKEAIAFAVNNNCPVVSQGIEYQCIAAVIYPRNRKTLLQLADKNANSVTIASAEDVNFADAKDFEKMTELSLGKVLYRCREFILTLKDGTYFVFKGNGPPEIFDEPETAWNYFIEELNTTVLNRISKIRN